MKQWQRLTHFFEHGDLTPFAVVISIAHYGPVLVAHGEHWLVAWIVGALVDMLHFRTVRRAVTSAIWIDRAIALGTTAIASMYHLRFYAGDWVLALPIPIGIAILAYHTASQQKDTSQAWQTRAETAETEAKRLQEQNKSLQEQNKALQTSADEAQRQRNDLQNQVNHLQAELSQAQTTNIELQNKVDDQQTSIKAWQMLNSEVQTLARYGAGQYTAEQAASLIGVADKRTVESRAAKLNGTF